ncbi:MAG: hypothetical protein KAT70_00100 [Thermoplasmata archaeon]|nr:hypothetical protein [Thermoplasmata archaeon]
MRTVLLFIADNVERAIRESLGGEEAAEEVAMGADGTPTVRVDEAADKAVLEALDTLGSDLNVLSEESGFTDRGGDKVLVVDPLDGTHNALKGSGPFAISLAIGKNSTDDLEVGLVRDLVSGNDYVAIKGGGAYKNDRPIHTSTFSLPDSTFSIYLGSMATERCVTLATLPRRLRYFGCIALEICLVASGVLDLYLVEATREDRNTRVTDVAAASLILKEAGGMMLTANKDPFMLPFDLEHRSSLLAIGDPKALDVIE